MAVETAAKPQVSRLRRTLTDVGRALTNPLLPDDYLALINPMWSTRELQGEVVHIRRETPLSRTIVIKPSFRWPGHVPGQYLRIGVEIDGVRHWRAYTLTSDPGHPEGWISISVRRVDGGKMSPFFTRQAGVGTVVYLGEVEGNFSLPDPVPERLLMISAGSGITPIFSLLRAIERNGPVGDIVHLHSERNEEEILFADLLRGMAKRHRSYKRVERLTSKAGRIAPKDLDKLCKDWRERDTFLSGPPGLLEAMANHWEEEGIRDRLSLEHFQPFVGDGGEAGLGAGGKVRFRVTDFEAECDGETSILVGGEEAGGQLTYGCRMGVCHTCICKLVDGMVRDMRTGQVHGEPGEMIRTCINAPEGDIVVDEGHVVIRGTPARSKG